MGPSAFEKGLRPMKIVAVSWDRKNNIIFKMKWEGAKRLDWVLAEETNLLCPLIVIRFYESSELWKGSYPPSMEQWGIIQ
ncbi:unnamed protein product [Orchesella dallaii]|uniref:Chromo shadow domain-containing protein n=1 Tax=Orchesella dallaii TaxID=48710 RepID=A0ABP1RRH3_9HEXA